MTSWRQIFDFRRAPYLRPNETWICGRAAQGVPCRLGPGGMGRCRTHTECDPIFSQGDWVCTRPGEFGGKCEEGPSEDGACCREIPKCVPVRNLRSLRGRVSFWVFTATLLGLVTALGTDLRFEVFDPGPVIQGHSGVAGCDSCHAVGQTSVGNWLKAAWAPADPAASSAKCLTCHDRGQNAMRPHSMSKTQLAKHTENITLPSASLGDVSTHLVNGTVFPTHKSVRETVACATCHKDHKGLNFDPNVVSNGRCQACHKQKFASLDDGHPSFGDYPYVRRSRLAFDHYKHFQRHFGQAKSKTPPTKCANCHVPDPTGRYMVVIPFQQTCGGCHTKDIEGTGLAGAKGVPVFSVPGLDAETLKKRGFSVGQWPEDADSDGISPFVKVLLAADAQLDRDLRQLAGVDLQELRGASKSVLAAAQRVGWGFKQLLYELGRHGGEAVHVRLANGFGLALDREAVGRLVGNIPRDVIRAAQARWFPRLAREISRHRRRRADLIPGNPQSHAGLSDRGMWEPAPPVRLALAGPAGTRALFGLGLRQELFGAFPQRSDALSENQRKAPRVQLAQTGDLLKGNSKLIDGSSLRLKEYKALKREDRGADNSIFKKGSSSRSSTRTRARRKEPKKKSVAKKPEKKKQKKRTADRPPRNKEKTVAKKPEKKKVVTPRTERPKEPVVRRAEPQRDKVRREVPELAAPTPPLQRPKRMTRLGPLPDPERWARSGGWYRIDFTLYYRPAEHKDAFMQSWLDFAAKAHGGQAQLYGEALLSAFRNADTVGKCVRCHSVDRVAGGQLTINWKPFKPDPDKQKFTVFDHATHFSMAGERGCQSCHRLNPKAKFAVAYRGLDATSFESNFFSPIKRETCAECHVPESSGNACIQCHRYHVGEFVSAPIVTEIATRQGSTTRFGTARPKARNAKKSTRKSKARRNRTRPQKSVVAETPKRSTPKRQIAAVPSRAPPKRQKPRPSVDSRPVTPTPRVASRDADIRRFPLPKRKPAFLRDGTVSRVGQFAIQLSSFRTEDRAERSKRRLQRSLADDLDGQVLLVERARLSRNRQMYRVVARPFESQRMADRICRRIKAKRKLKCRVIR